MNAKEYLSQAYHIDKLIRSKQEQAQMYRDIATKMNAPLSNTPSSGANNVHCIEDSICAFIDLENEINADIRNLMQIKRDVSETINSVGNPTYQTLLELRYLCYKPWAEIADAMNYERRYLLKLHKKALLKLDTKRHLKTCAKI